MAEVPEVETLVRDLRQAVVGRVILAADVVQAAAVRLSTADEFSTGVAGRRVLAAERRAKFILLPLSDDWLMAVHLMLWGTLVLVPADQPNVPDTLVVWHLDRDEDLRLIDKLGYARAAAGPGPLVAERLGLHALGPEVMDPGFDAAALARQLGRRRGVIKTVLLNQRVLAGLGNRDADESLWLAGIDPGRAANSLTPAELERLHAAMVRVLAEGVELRGTQRDLFGHKGRARHRRYVFERSGQACPRCGTAIRYTRLGGRNTFYCAGCQR